MPVGVLISILSGLLPALFGALPGMRLWKSLHAWLLKAVNTEVSLTFLYVRRYSDRWSRHPERGVWEPVLDAADSSDRLTIRSRSDQSVSARFHNLDLDLHVWLGEELDLGGDEAVVVGYKVAVDTGEPMRIAVRRLKELQHLSVLAGRIQDRIGRHCFMGQEPHDGYLVCTLKLPGPLLKIGGSKHHAETRSRAYVSGDTLTVVCEEPSYLMAAITVYARV